MNGDDFHKAILNQSGKIAMGAFAPQDDFDDISSIYTAANARNEKLESTMKRVRDRDERLSAMEDLDDINKQMNNPNFLDHDENNDLRMITEKDEELLSLIHI